MNRLKLLILLIVGVGSGICAAGQDSRVSSMKQRVAFFYDNTTLYPAGASSSAFNGFGLGYNIEFPVSKSMPLYVGSGIDFHFLFHDKKLENMIFDNAIEQHARVTFANLNIPVNLTYRVPVSGGFCLTPEVGLDFRIQLYGNAKIRTEINDIIPGVDMNIYPQGTDGINLFSGKQLGDEHLRRFQMGWHAGLNFEYYGVDLGLSYGTDFVKLHKNLGAGHFIVSVGYNF